MIDVSELQGDPDFAQTIVRLRPTTTYAHEGVAGSTTTSASVVGCVQPPGDDEVKLLPEGVRLADCIAFYTNGDVSAGDGASQLPDILQWQGKSFRVLYKTDWSQNGYVRFIAHRYPAGATP